MYIDRNSGDCDSWYITCILIEIQETVIHGTLHVYCYALEANSTSTSTL